MYSMIHVLNDISTIYVQYGTCAGSHNQHLCTVWYMCWITQSTFYVQLYLNYGSDMSMNCVFFCQHNKKGVIIVMLLYSYKYGLASLLTLHGSQSFFCCNLLHMYHVYTFMVRMTKILEERNIFLIWDCVWLIGTRTI
jgi:hypothetical protein